MCLSVLRYIFRSRSKRGLYDLNKKAEPFFRDVLNLTYSWSLEDMNAIQTNYPAIDLGDEDSGVCIQVTAEDSSTKISKTIDKFLEKNLHKKFSRLIILIITSKKNYSKTFKTDGKIKFSAQGDIKDIDDLLSDIEKLPLSKLTELHKLVTSELSTVVKLFAEPDSLLARAEKRVELPPKNGGLLFIHLEYEEEELVTGIKELKQFYKKISSLPRNTREFLQLIIINGNESSTIGNNRITIQPRKLDSISRMGEQAVRDEFRLLEEVGIASYDDSDQVPYIEVSYPLSTGVELLGAIKDFSKTDAQLSAILVECDFTLLDSL